MEDQCPFLANDLVQLQWIDSLTEKDKSPIHILSQKIADLRASDEVRRRCIIFFFNIRLETWRAFAGRHIGSLCAV
jgi:hypothetical protein